GGSPIFEKEGVARFAGTVGAEPAGLVDGTALRHGFLVVQRWPPELAALLLGLQGLLREPLRPEGLAGGAAQRVVVASQPLEFQNPMRLADLLPPGQYPAAQAVGLPAGHDWQLNGVGFQSCVGGRAIPRP